MNLTKHERTNRTKLQATLAVAAVVSFMGPVSADAAPKDGDKHLPDLTVEDISWSTTDGTNYEIVAAIQNHGKGAVTNPVKVIFEGPAVGAPQEAWTSDRIKHGETVYVSILEDIATPGTWEIRATIDPDDLVDESREDNNVRVEAITK